MAPKKNETEEEKRARRLDEHRARVRKSAEARVAATSRLVREHREEFNVYHEEEKALRGIKSQAARKAAKEQAQLLELLNKYPEFARPEPSPYEEAS